MHIIAQTHFANTVTSRKYNLSLSTKRREQDATFSLMITLPPPPPLDQEMLAVLWMLALFLCCHSTTETLNLIV